MSCRLRDGHTAVSCMDDACDTLSLVREHGGSKCA